MSEHPFCLWCLEPVLPDERQEATQVVRAVGASVAAYPAVRHYECAARVVAGSVGHQLGLCTCCDGPGSLDDPTGLSDRDAARMALAVSNALCRYADDGPNMLERAMHAMRLTARELERRRAWNIGAILEAKP
jgi:hypothetical protein